MFTINYRINSIFARSRCYAFLGDLKGLMVERKKLNEFVRDGVTKEEVLRDFDGEMNYLYSSLHLYHKSST